MVPFLSTEKAVRRKDIREQLREEAGQLTAETGSDPQGKVVEQGENHKIWWAENKGKKA